jgi:hypothetical protein
MDAILKWRRPFDSIHRMLKKAIQPPMNAGQRGYAEMQIPMIK